VDVAARLGSPASPLVQVAPGTLLGPYEIEVLLGAGGMGRVFRARDTRLGRAVAIKVCDEPFSGRFGREARSIAALNHPHICTLHDVGPNYLVMELVEGETLASVLRRGLQPVDEALLTAAQIADALAAAHTRGIVHRDLKPSNVMITPTGVKVLDFGLAKRAATDAEPNGTAPTAADGTTGVGEIVGTVAYMSPEQAEGKPVDARSDVFSFGVMLYEMLCGRRPFSGETTLATLSATLRAVPDPPRSLRKEIPERAESVVLRCLRKTPKDRYASAGELRRDLVALRVATIAAGNRLRVAVIAAGLTVVAGAAAWGINAYVQRSRMAWVEREAVPGISRLINENRRMAAQTLFRQAESYAPASPPLFALAEGVVTTRMSFQTTPAGARIYISDYTAGAGDAIDQWQLLGETPFETKLPLWGYYRIRALKEGFASVEQSNFPLGEKTVQLTLHAEREVPPAMVWVPAHAPTAPAPTADLPGYWIDKYEVTNRQFKSFVDAGGYTKKEYWTHRFMKDDREISWQEAMENFRDATRRPGPAGWQLGTYPEGADALPVGGVSWYEAAAYAEFAGKSLPTVYEWFGAAGAAGGVSDILPLSNFGGRGPAVVGTHRGIARFGSYDMAGNVKEWAANARDDRCYALGGSWDEPEYVFSRPDAKPPLFREPTVGFRLVRRISPPPEETFEPVKFGPRDAQRAQPVDDEAFQIFAGLHAYDKTELDPKVEHVLKLPYWRRETVTFRAAYGNERVIAHLFLPNNATPPYQIVAFFGHSGILTMTRIEDLELPYEFVLRSGRALIIPAYSGSLERGPSPRLPTSIQTRDRALKWSMDLSRSIDYLETRPDIDTSKLAYYGVSLGAAEGVRLVAMDPRFKTAVLASGGLRDTDLPEVDAWNFAPRVHIPVLMLNGRDDFIFPVETHQRPLFEALGTQKPDKVFGQFDGGHANLLTRPDLIGEILDWLDKYLGPIDLPSARR
jgi:formylglycine-generating enzyme required for sulfatase activity